MKMTMMAVMVAVVVLGGCAGRRLQIGANQCTAPTESEAQITKKVWMK